MKKSKGDKYWTDYWRLSLYYNDLPLSVNKADINWVLCFNLSQLSHLTGGDLITTVGVWSLDPIHGYNIRD